MLTPSVIVSWSAQRISSLGLVSLLTLLYLALWHDNHRSANEISKSQLVLACYTVLVHILALAFPLRLCYATWRLTQELKSSAAERELRTASPSRLAGQTEKEAILYQSEVSADDSSTTSFSSSSSEINVSDAESCASSFDYDDSVIHVIILPNYKESIDTLRETLEVLACHPQAGSTYEICLAMEQGEDEACSKVTILILDFKKCFRDVYSTLHPRGIEGEAQGKSSNLCWSANYVSTKYADDAGRRNIILTVIDADSQLSATYFSHVTSLHVNHPTTSACTIYVPPIVFDRNAHHVPRLVRMADILWSGAGMSGHYKSSYICPPTSVYSLPLTLVDKAGGWDAGDVAIGEDLHMYIKCFFALHGNLTTRTVLSAASQSNVHSSGQGIRGLYTNLKARYKQALRHMWGALDSGYVVKASGQMFWKNVTGACDDRPNYLQTGILLHRMFEAHFLPTHITLILLTTTLYTLLTPAAQVPALLSQSLLYSDRLRLLSLVTFASFFTLYESFHYTCVTTRELEMVAAGLAGKMDGAFNYRNNWRRNVLDYATFPIAGIIFGSFPAVVAQMCHFWTLKLVYKVSRKPERKGVAMS